MKITLSEQLRRLRRERGSTQEELADLLGISAQAVSKWERGEAMPDITLLPLLARYYRVSVDELLGVDRQSREARIQEICDEYNRIRHHEPFDKDYGLGEGIALIRAALRELPGEFFLEQLLAADLSYKSNSAAEPEKTALREEAVALCEDILTHCTEDRWRSCAQRILLVVYAACGRRDKALELAYQMPGPFCTCEYMLTYIMEGDELRNQWRKVSEWYYRVFRQSILKQAELGTERSQMAAEGYYSKFGICREEYQRCVEAILSAEQA